MKEVDFFSYSHIIMNLEELKDIIKDKLRGIKVGVRYKIIFRGKQAPGDKKEVKPIRAIHLEIRYNKVQKDFQRIMERYGRLKSGFTHRRKMRF